jgi:hypothetical protein
MGGGSVRRFINHNFDVLIGVCDATISHCASLFFSYSVDELRMLDRSLIHKLMNSPSLKLASEDALLHRIIELGNDYFELAGYIDFRLLSDGGIAILIDALDLVHITPAIWSNL